MASGYPKSQDEDMAQIKITLLIMVAAVSTGLAQPSQDIVLIKQYHAAISSPISTGNAGYEMNRAASTPSILSGMISFYQQFISSQDIPSCVFTPSCSHYAQDCLHAFSLPKALLLISDRLQRCNKIRPKEKLYRFDFRQSRFVDPADDFYK